MLENVIAASQTTALHQWETESTWAVYTLLLKPRQARRRPHFYGCVLKMALRPAVRGPEAEMFLLPVAEMETDELSGSRGHLAASIQTDQSFGSSLFQPSDRALPVETLSCEVRGHTNSPTPSSFPCLISSISVPSFSALSLLPSSCDTLAYWSGRRRDH